MTEQLLYLIYIRPRSNCVASVKLSGGQRFCFPRRWSSVAFLNADILTYVATEGQKLAFYL